MPEPQRGSRPGASVLPSHHRLYRARYGPAGRVSRPCAVQNRRCGDPPPRSEPVVLALPTPEGMLARFSIPRPRAHRAGATARGFVAGRSRTLPRPVARSTRRHRQAGRFDWTEKGSNALSSPSSAGALPATPPHAPGDTSDYLVYDAARRRPARGGGEGWGCGVDSARLRGPWPKPPWAAIPRRSAALALDPLSFHDARQPHLSARIGSPLPRQASLREPQRGLWPRMPSP